MGQRSRKRRADPGAGGAGSAEGGAAAMRRGYARGEARNQAIRDSLEPVRPGERPRALVVAIAVAVILAVTNLAFLIGGYEVRGEQPALGGVLLLSGLLLAAAVGMWLLQYWAILGFQALLGISVAVAGLSLMLTAQDARAIAVCLAVLLGAGTLFWKLVRVMARIQMPDRPGRERDGTA